MGTIGFTSSVIKAASLVIAGTLSPKTITLVCKWKTQKNILLAKEKYNWTQAILRSRHLEKYKRKYTLMYVKSYAKKASGKSLENQLFIKSRNAFGRQCRVAPAL